MVRNLLFDMGGVVFKQDTPEAFRRFRAAGVDPDYYMGAYGQKDFFLDLETGLISTDEFCAKMAHVSGRESVTYDEALYCWLGFVDEVPAERLHNLLTLKEKYHLGLLSNTNPFIMGFMLGGDFSAERRPISDYFHSLFLSYEMKVCKPCQDIFLKALAADGMKAEETIFIDDSLANVRAAESLGIRGLHVKTNEDWMPALGKMLD